MGRVWAARRLSSPTAQFVAVKTALDELSGDPEFERIFVDEARIASSIVHPNVCTIYELGAERGIPYLVMEWVSGGSLHDILAASPDRRLAPDVAARMVANASGGLHAAHELTDIDGTPLHVVHRDVSPQNILISESGHVKVADFGVARAKGQLHKPTATGELKGKLSYMAPEQLTTKLFDRRADIFALGCVLFQATTGQRPFHGNDALETMYRLLETECERPSTFCPDYPQELEAIVLRALAKTPEERYQTAEELEIALDRFLASRGKLVTDRDIAEVVARTLGTVVSARNDELKRALERTAHPGKTVAPGGKGSPGAIPIAAVHHDSTQDRSTSGERALPFFEESTGTPRGNWESQRPAPSERKKRFAAWSALVAGALLALGIGTSYSLRGANSAATPTGSASGHLGKESVAVSVQPVEVRIHALPPGATVELDNGLRGMGELSLTLPPSPQVRTVTATMPGYVTSSRQLSFERSTEIWIELSPRVPVGAAPSVPERPVPPARSGANGRGTSVGTSSTATPATPTDIAHTKVRRPKRPLDPNNPFVDP